jgi:hypothetical protein
VSFCFVTAFVHDYRAYLSIVIIFLSHFVIDSIKAWSEKRLTSYFTTYWFDQICHYLTIFLASLPFWQTQVALPISLIIYLCGALFCTYTLEFSVLQFSRKKGNNYLPHDKPNYPQMLLRLLIFTGIFLIFHPFN